MTKKKLSNGGQASASGRLRRPRLGPDGPAPKRITYPEVLRAEAEAKAASGKLKKSLEAKAAKLRESYRTETKAEFDRIEAVTAEAETLGSLIVETPGLRFERWEQPAVIMLREAAEGFREVAREHANGEAVAVSYILSAVLRAIDLGDIAELQAGPFTWARKYIRPKEGTISALVPIEDGKGSLQKINEFSGGFYKLAAVIKWALEKTLATSVSLDTQSEIIALVLAHSFPSIPSLSKGEKRLFEIEKRIKPKLHEKGARARLVAEERLKLAGRKGYTAADIAEEIPESTAADIAEEILKDEFELSGKKAEIARAFRFLNEHKRKA